MTTKTEIQTQPQPVATDLLKRPYSRIVIPEEDGSFRAEVLEFSGCFATGDTAGEALDSVEFAAADWITAALAQGQSIPDPVENTEFSGRLALRLPKSLHKKASFLAERDGVSLNQFIVICIAECAGERARRVSPVSVTISTAMNFIAIAAQTPGLLQKIPGWISIADTGQVVVGGNYA
jgi:predicted RNase H-like HicB family nuclease